MDKREIRLLCCSHFMQATSAVIQRTEVLACVCVLDRKQLKVKGEKFIGQNVPMMTVAGTCGGFSVHRFKNGVLIHSKQSNHVASAGIQPRDAQG